MTITDLLARVTGDPYRSPPRVPDRPPGVPGSVPVGVGIDCSTLTAWVLLSAYRDRLTLEQAQRLYRDLQIQDHTRPWSPVEGAIGADIGGLGAVEGARNPWGWTLAQSWRGLVDGRVVASSRGHARLIAPDGAVWEASQRRARVDQPVSELVVSPGTAEVTREALDGRFLSGW